MLNKTDENRHNKLSVHISHIYTYSKYALRMLGLHLTGQFPSPTTRIATKIQHNA